VISLKRTVIIGGADGPTAIFITSSVNWQLIMGAISSVLIGIITLCAILYKKKLNG
jgi:Na+-transporting methylmalonyl-CoA/oxaloacetate decarboxylase beta subunit